MLADKRKTYPIKTCLSRSFHQMKKRLLQNSSEKTTIDENFLLFWENSNLFICDVINGKDDDGVTIIFKHLDVVTGENCLLPALSISYFHAFGLNKLSKRCVRVGLGGVGRCNVLSLSVAFQWHNRDTTRLQNVNLQQMGFQNV